MLDSIYSAEKKQENHDHDSKWQPLCQTAISNQIFKLFHIFDDVLLSSDQKI